MSVRAPGNPPILDASAATTNPSTNDVIADTGALSVGRYEVRVLVGASVAALFSLQRRNAANGANVGDVPILYIAAGQTAEYILIYTLEASERVRLICTTGFTGTCAATIQVEQLN